MKINQRKKTNRKMNRNCLFFLFLFLCNLTSAQDKDTCISDEVLKEAVIIALEYDPKLYNLHIDSSRLPIQLVKNKFSKNYSDIIIFDKKVELITKKQAKRDIKDYTKITNVSWDDCFLEIHFFNNLENAGGEFRFVYKDAQLLILESSIYEY